MKHENTFIIQVDQLKNGEQKKISERLSPSFLELSPEDEIRNSEPVLVDGLVYLTDEYLILDLNIQANLILVCGYCNESFNFPVKRTHFMHEEAIENIPKGIFDIGDFVRQTILLEVPFYQLCGGKECHNRKRMEKFLSQKKEEQFHPFKDLHD